MAVLELTDKPFFCNEENCQLKKNESGESERAIDECHSSLSSSAPSRPFSYYMKGGQKWNRCNANVAFKYIKSGTSMSDLRNRCEEICKIFPSQRHYVENELLNNILLFADISRIWTLDFGLTTTSLQENSFWTLKSGLNGHTVFANKLPEYIGKAFHNRQLRFEQKGKVTTKTIMRRIQDDKLKELHNALETYCTEEGQRIIGEAINDRSTCILEEEIDCISNLSRKMELLQEAKTFHSNKVNRFSIFACRRTILKIWRLKSNDDKLFLFCMDDNGDIACTCGDFASYGRPCSHFFLLYIIRKVNFNVCSLCHPVYLKDEMHFCLDRSAVTVKRSDSNNDPIDTSNAS